MVICIIPWYLAVGVMALTIIFAWWATKPKKYEYDLTQITEVDELLLRLDELNGGLYETTPIVFISIDVVAKLLIANYNYNGLKKNYPKLKITVV
jgi:hypothetical protein